MTRSFLLLEHPPRRANRWWRLARAISRDSLALWREFRRSIIVFLVAIFVGGYIYGELLVQAGYPRLPFIEMPFYMLLLLLLQVPGEIPSQPQLLIFWYVMPILSIYIIGQGIVDFVRLFFNRNERRNAWEEAVASTYRHHVIVMGAGHLGVRVIRSLVQMGFDVIAIDNAIKPEPGRELVQLHVPLIAADGRLPDTLERAGLRDADAFIVCTSDDYMNLEVTMRARDLNRHIRIVVRMWDIDFAQQIKQFMNVEAVLSASDLAAPMFAGSALGIQITQTVQVSGVDYSMIELRVEPGSFLDGATVERLEQQNNMDIVLQRRNDQVEVHPAHESMVIAGDTLVIFAQHNQITDIVARNRRRQ